MKRKPSIVFTMLILILNFSLLSIIFGTKLNAAADLKLPYPSGVTYTVTAGYNTTGSGHHSANYSKYAIDFGMPIGSKIVAVKAGKVKALKENSQTGGCNTRYQNNANYVVIDHLDGTQTVYMHLSYNSVDVSVGESVYQGQPIAKSGQTGYSCGAHLHFSRQKLCSDINGCESIPLKFSDSNVVSQNADGQLSVGKKYTSSNIEQLPPSVACAGSLCPVYRFYSDKDKEHFFTINLSERNTLIRNYWNFEWKYEGDAFKAYTYSNSKCSGNAKPVYRFYHPTNTAHFYTISETEKNNLVRENLWKYEGISFCAFSSKVTNSKPLYRFWSGKLLTHFYTASETEKNKLITNDSATWKYEGIAFYVM